MKRQSRKREKDRKEQNKGCISALECVFAAQSLSIFISQISNTLFIFSRRISLVVVVPIVTESYIPYIVMINHYNRENVVCSYEHNSS